MPTITITADYIGSVIKSIRDKKDITAEQLAHLLGCGGAQLHRYEEGVDLIPRDVLKRVFKYAAKMDSALGKE